MVMVEIAAQGKEVHHVCQVSDENAASVKQRNAMEQ